MNVMVLAAVLLVPMLPAQAPRTQEERGARVMGRVRSVTTGIPIPSAVVTLGSSTKESIAPAFSI